MGEPTTTVEELLVGINPRLERLESSINVALVSAVAEVRVESETVLEPTDRRRKSTSCRPKKPRKSGYYSDSSGSDRLSSDGHGTSSEDSENSYSSGGNSTDDDSPKSRR